MATPLPTEEREALRQALLDAQARAEASDYPAALERVQRARSTSPGNVYILAFEKQVEQLSALTGGGALTEEAKTDILESLGGIVDRAVSAAAETPTTAPSASASPATREDRAAAMEWLKSQYFQQAHQYVRRGEHDHALAEIRRVFVLEPGNETARQFESHILELKELHQLVPAEAPASEPVAPRSTPSAPAAPPPVAAPTPAETEPPPAKKRSGAVIVGVIAVAMAFIGFALIYNWVRTTEVREEPPPVVMPQPEVFFGDPVTVPDTGRTAGTAQEDTVQAEPPSAPEQPSEAP